MKHKSWFPKALSAAVLTAALCLPVAAEAGPETARAQIWNRHMQVDDVLWVAFLDEEGRSLYPLAMKGVVYIPLRSVGEWLGGSVTWDQEQNTVALTSGESEPYYLSLFTPEGPPEPTQAEQAQFEQDLAQGVEVALRPDIRVTLNGAEQHLADANGRPITPVVLRERVYLPVRNVAAMCGKSILWYTDGRDDEIYLYDAPTQAQLDQAQTYFDQCAEGTAAILADVENLAAETGLSEDLFRERVQGVRAALEALAALDGPELGPVVHFGTADSVVQDILDQWVAPYLDPEGHLAPAELPGYLEAGWQAHRDRFVEDMERELPRIQSWVQLGRDRLEAVQTAQASQQTGI